jgi:hypothetical protein
MSEDSVTGVTVTVLAGELRRALTATLAAAGTDDIPLLAGVHLEAGRGVLTATSTDRYIAAHARVKTQDTEPASLAPAMVDSAAVRTLLHAMGSAKPTQSIRLAQAGPALTFHIGRWSITTTCADEHLPNMEKIFTGELKGRRTVTAAGDLPELPPVVAEDILNLDLNTTVLARVSAVLRTLPRDTAVHWRVNAASALAPVLLDASDWLLVCVMPMRRQPGVQHVVYGLPPEPPTKRVRKKPTSTAIEAGSKAAPRRARAAA